MALGRTPRQTDLLRSTVDYCADRVASDSIYAIPHRECFTLFPDEMFADLFTDIGRRSVPPMIVSVVMVLQRIEGCSDREAVDRFAFDARWKYAAGGLDFDYPGFVHTVLVDMRARLARSDRPDRIFQVVLGVAGQAGLVERKRVLDSTPIYATDPDSEIITATHVTPGNSGDAEVAEDLLADILSPEAEAEARPAVYGDAAYGAGELLVRLDDNGVYNGLKVQPPARVKGHYGKDSFTIDLDAKTVTCPAGVVVGIRAHGGRHAGTAQFGAACADCPLRAGCTTATAGRSIAISPHEAHLAAGRARQNDPVWKADYRATRPKVERKIGHLMWRRHGGRRAWVRGRVRVAADFSLLAAAVNLARLGRLGVVCRAGVWTAATA